MQPATLATMMTQTLDTIATNFTVYILAFGSIDIVGTEIVAPRIGICATTI